jgi:Xaa-Pro dipeptidase
MSLNRRDLLKLGSAAAGAAVLPGAISAQEDSSPRVRLTSRHIESLKSMKDQAKPITKEERAARIENAQRLMVSNNLDAIILCGGTSLVYFANVHWWLSERFTGLVITAKGDVFFVTPAFEEERTREQMATGPLGAHTDVRIWNEHENPYVKLAQGLADRGIKSGRIGVEERTYFVYEDGLAHAAPAMQMVSAIPVTAGCRQIKSEHEIALMRLAALVTLKAYEAAYITLKEHKGDKPVTQNDFAAWVSAAHTKLGFSGGAGVQVGEYSALPHGSVQPQVIHENEILLMDGGCSVEGYQSDISRTFVLGKPTDKMKKVFDIDRRAQDAALKTAKPGVACEDVDAAARKVIVDAGYGPDYKYFGHRLGHGMGMDGHEWPYLVRGNKLPMQANMTFSNEPGVYIRGEFGVRVEDDMHITQDGAELFTPQSPSLEDPFGAA